MESSVSPAILEGVFAIHKPAGITSAQVVRDIKYAFTKSAYFKPWLKEEQQRRIKEGFKQRNRRNSSHKKVEIKVGHGGTLDPAATGCLVIGIGKGTKQLQSFMESRKSYDAVILFGAATDSYDGEGKILATAPFDHITEEKVKAALEKFRGDIKQQPPIFSALKMNGEKLYEYARSGKALPREIEERPAKVYHLEMTEWLQPSTHEFKWPSMQAPSEEIAVGHKLLDLPESDGIDQQTDTADGPKRKRSVSPEPTEPRKEQKLTAESSKDDDEPANQQINTSAEQLEESTEKPPAARLTMDVGSGFYVRSLCHDLGKAVDSLGFMARLVRTKQGPFLLNQNVLPYEDLKAGEKVWQPKIQTAFEEWDRHLISWNSNDGKSETVPESAEATEGK